MIEYRKRHNKELRAYWKKYGQTPNQLAYKKRYWEKNKEKLSLNFKEYSNTEKGKIVVRKAGYKYFLKNLKKVHKRNKIYRQKHMDKVLFWNHKRKMIKNKIEGSHTLEEWQEVLKKSRGICPACYKEIGIEKLTKDHIKPISCGGTDYIWNIQALCKKCNSSKGTDMWHAQIIFKDKKLCPNLSVATHS